MCSTVSPTHQKVSVNTNGEKSFIRGLTSVDTLPLWQREDLARKQKMQQETQDALLHQIAEKEAERARKEALRRQEDEKEQARLVKEQDHLRKKYAVKTKRPGKKSHQSESEVARYDINNKTTPHNNVKQPPVIVEKSAITSHTRHVYQSQSPPIPVVLKKMRRGANSKKESQDAHASPVENELANEDKKIRQDLQSSKDTPQFKSNVSENTFLNSRANHGSPHTRDDRDLYTNLEVPNVNPISTHMSNTPEIPVDHRQHKDVPIYKDRSKSPLDGYYISQPKRWNTPTILHPTPIRAINQIIHLNSDY
ncbi:hypothetical protein BASA83_001840 [Batrachochytrium salamandrivorans]|nr:hypothetical protein BASA83_001840 [Batrachochytrium salamandrivorans]